MKSFIIYDCLHFSIPTSVLSHGFAVASFSQSVSSVTEANLQTTTCDVEVDVDGDGDSGDGDGDNDDDVDSDGDSDDKGMKLMVRTCTVQVHSLARAGPARDVCQRPQKLPEQTSWSTGQSLCKRTCL